MQKKSQLQATVEFWCFMKAIFVQKKKKKLFLVLYEESPPMRLSLLRINFQIDVKFDLFALSLSFLIHFLAELVCCIKITYDVFLTTDYLWVSQTKYGGGGDQNNQNQIVFCNICIWGINT